MQNIKSFLKKYSRKWYFWVGTIFLIALIGSSIDPVEQTKTEVTIPEQQVSSITADIPASTESTIPETKAITPTGSTTTIPVPIQKPATNIVSGYRVVSVVDGDTIKVDIDGTTETIRIIGLNTPETVDPRKPVECFGKEASNKAKELLSGKTVTLEADSTQGERDKYGRLLRYVFMSNGTDYGKYMISSGYAYEYTYSKPYKYQASYKSTQKSAESSKAGLWGDNACKTATVVAPSTTSTMYYTSSASNASKYYPSTCPEWEQLSKTNLKSFNSLEALLAVYPKRTLAEICK